MAISKFLILFLIILATVNIASAEDYTAKLQYEVSQVDKWTTPFQFTLDIGESKTIGGVTVIYDDIGNSNTMVHFTITGSPDFNDVNLQKNEIGCILGTCKINTTSNIPLQTGDIRIKLLDIVKSVDSSSVSSSDNIIDLYILCSNNERLYLNKDSQNNYNPSLCTTKEGWSSTTEKEIFMYLKRNFNVPFSLEIETDGGYKEEAFDSNTGRYTLQSNTKYIFNVKTKRTTIWGGEIEENSVYTIVITGLNSVSSGSSTSATPTPTPSILSYTAFVGDNKEITLVNGVFESNSVIAPTKIGNPETGKTTYQISFTESGTTKLKYTPTSGSPFDIQFIVREKPTTTSNPKKASQTNTGDMISDNLLVIIALLLIIVAVVYYLKSSKKGKGRTVSDSDERA